MDCREVEELIDAYALDALEAAEREQVARHIHECGDCRVQYEAARRVVDQLGLAAPLKRAPRDLFHRTMADVYRDLSNAPPTERKVSARTMHWFERGLAPVAALAAAVAAVASLGLVMNLDGRVDDIDDQDQQQMSLVNSAVQEQALVNVALTADDLLKANLGEPSPGAVQGKYYWTPEDGVGVLWLSGLQAGHEYTACFEAGESGLQRIPGHVVAHPDGSAQKAFFLVRGERVVAIGLTNDELCPSVQERWLYYWPVGRD